MLRTCINRKHVVELSDVERADLFSLHNESFSLKIVATNADGTAHDLTPYTINFEVKNSAGAIVLSAAAGTGLTISGVGSNIITIEKTAVEMSAVPANQYSYRLLFEDGAYLKSWLGGALHLSASLPRTNQVYLQTAETTVRKQNQYVNLKISE